MDKNDIEIDLDRALKLAYDVSVLNTSKRTSNVSELWDRTIAAIRSDVTILIGILYQDLRDM